MEISKNIKDSVKDTIGYNEASNKESFMIGAGVAFKRAEDFYAKVIKDLKSQVEGYKLSYETVAKDMDTLTNIIRIYTTNKD